MYCCKCGFLLKKEKVSEVLKKGESGYSDSILGHPTLGMTEKAISHYIYRCPNCNTTISYDFQCIVAKKQERLKKKILDKND